jgi:hypothetical protein
MGIISDAQLIGKALQEAGRIELNQKIIEIQIFLWIISIFQLNSPNIIRRKQ